MTLKREREGERESFGWLGDRRAHNPGATVGREGLTQWREGKAERAALSPPNQWLGVHIPPVRRLPGPPTHLPDRGRLPDPLPRPGPPPELFRHRRSLTPTAADNQIGKAGRECEGSFHCAHSERRTAWERVHPSAGEGESPLALSKNPLPSLLPCLTSLPVR